MEDAMKKMPDNPNAILRIAQRLGRKPGDGTPQPPVIPEPVVRLVFSDLGLAELFSSTANNSGLMTEMVSPEDLVAAIQSHLQSLGIDQVVMPKSKMLQKLHLPAMLAETGTTVAEFDPSDPIASDEMLITDCLAAIAETASLVFSKSAPPPTSIVILEPRNFVPDLIDLFEMLGKQIQDVAMISGPGQLKVFVLN
jgi:L-lactate utilization protein LutC